MVTGATIDIGSNSVLLFIGRLRSGHLFPVLEQQAITSLGSGLFRSPTISAAAIKRTKQVLTKYSKEISGHGIKNVSAVGTAAFREAVDGNAVASLFSRVLGAPVRILTAREEAFLTFKAVAYHYPTRTPIGLIDLGGNSSEIIFGAKDRIIKWESLPFGAITGRE
jgi:exopolyphosphatase/guanosine-5'-triphosphate,3'-diphosphate pyrophosphatase